MAIFGTKKTDPNKILPIKYKFAREYYLMGVNNNWVPQEIPMQDDIEQWKTDTITDDERRLILFNLGFFSTAESLTANNIVLAVYNHVLDPACRQYLLRQAYEEAIHTDTFIYICDTFGFDPEEIYTMYETNEFIKKKDDFVVDLTKVVFDRDFVVDSEQQIRKFLHDLIGYYVIMEGIFFYAGFAMMLALKRQHKLVGIGEQFEFIMRDESVHLAFGSDLINTIVSENEGVWTNEFRSEIVQLIKRAVEIEEAYVYEACPNGILGIRPEDFVTYTKYVADRRFSRINLTEQYNVENPFPWLSESTDLMKEKNFFETTVTEYQSGGSLTWED